MATAPKLKSRYTLIGPIGEGGMGIVYKAYDTSLGREVAVKTLKESPDQAALDQFRKECDVQKSLHHPNIIEIYDYDVGDLDGTGVRKPYLVMPMMEGSTLDKLIRDSSPRLTVDNVVEMIVQVCRGMQAAHDRGLVHRDLKPSNLFVLEDNSIKIIDFGVAHLVDQKTTIGIKGTPLYMSPEQIKMEEATGLSDLFSIGVVCYESLTGRRPFAGGGRDDVARRILLHNPAPCHTLNPAVNLALSQVVHAAMAKQSYNRFASAREFAEALKKALRNEPIERFNVSRVQPRLDKARKAIEEADYEFAGEIIGALEAESCIHPDVEDLRRQVDRGVRNRLVQQLLDSARKRFGEQLLDLAYQKVQEALHIDPENSEASGLKTEIESQRNEQQIHEWFRLAHQHIDNHAYKLAKQALQNVVALKPADTQAVHLLSEVDHRESEYLRVRQRKESLYKAALENWQHGEVSSALSKLQQVVELDESWPDAVTPEFGPGYQDLYNQVRSAHEAIKSAYEAARRHLSEQNFDAASSICEEYHRKYPAHPLFQGLQFDIEERRRQAFSAYIARIDKDVEQEPDLNRKVAVLEEAVARHPVEHFQQSLKTTRLKRDLVNAIVTKARNFEDAGQLAEAIGQWEILRTIHSRYPGLDLEIESLTKRREQQVVAERKAAMTEEIDRFLGLGEFGKALEFSNDALRQYPNASEFVSLQELARKGLTEAAEAQRLLEEARRQLAEGHAADCMETLRRARDLDRRDPAIRALLVDTLLAEARRQLNVDWRKSDLLVQQAADIDPSSPQIKALRNELADKERAEFVDGCIRDARRAQADGDLVTAIGHVDRGLAAYRQESRLVQLRTTLDRALQDRRQQTRERDLEEARTIVRTIVNVPAPAQREALQKRADAIRNSYPDDNDFQSIFETMEPLRTVVASPQPPVGGYPAYNPPPPANGKTSARDQEPLTEPPMPSRPPKRPNPLGVALRNVAGKGQGAAAGVWATLAAPKSRKPLLIGGVVVASLLVVAGVAALWPESAPPPPARVQVTLTVTPPEAEVKIDNEAKSAGSFELAPGKHTVEASLEGFQPFRQDFDAPGEVRVAMVPLPPLVRVVTDLASGSVLLNDTKVADLVDGQYSLENPPVGSHTLKIESGRLTAVIPFTVAEGVAPALNGEAKASELKMVVVSSYRGRGKVQSNLGKGTLDVDGVPAGEIPAEGLELAGFGVGSRQLAFRAGPVGAHPVSMDVAQNPALFVSLTSDRNVGGIVVSANEDGYRVIVDDKQQRGVKTNNGAATLYNMEAGTRVVKIEKDEYRVEPESQQVEVKKGRPAKAEFKLIPLPQEAILQVEGAPPGMTVVVGGRSFQVGGDGRLNRSDIAPGDQDIQLRRAGYRSKTLNRKFEKRQTVRLAGADLNLEAALGTILFTRLSPPTMQVTVRQSVPVVPYTGPANVTGQKQISVPFGKYNVTGSAPGFKDVIVTLDIGHEEKWNVPIELPAEEKEEKKVETPKAVGMGGWEQPWTLEEGWHTRRGGLVLYVPQNRPGNFRFTIKRPSGGIAIFRKGDPIDWVCNWVDRSNYSFIRLTDDNLERWETKGGRERKVQTKKHTLDDKTEYRVDVIVRPNSILYSIKDQGVEKVSISYSGEKLDQGQFGFRVNIGSTFRMKDFLFTPAQ